MRRIAKQKLNNAFTLSVIYYDSIYEVAIIDENKKDLLGEPFKTDTKENVSIAVISAIESLVNHLLVGKLTSFDYHYGIIKAEKIDKGYLMRLDDKPAFIYDIEAETNDKDINIRYNIKRLHSSIKQSFDNLDDFIKVIH